MMNSGNFSERSERTRQQAARELAKRYPDDLLAFSEAYRMIGGRPMVVPPALIDIYRDSHPFMVIRKPSQVGATEFNINTALWVADSCYAGRGNALYMFPTQDGAARISQTRLVKAINESSYLLRRAAHSANELRAPASIFRRGIGPGLIYVTGADQETQYAGIDADCVILDEYDLMREEVLSLAQSRLRSSQRGLLRVTSTPTLPGVGVSELYDVSDQRYYELECPRCGCWQEPQFPGSIDWPALTVSCLECRCALDPWRPGRWLARQPNVTDVRGYQLSRLIFPNPPLADMKLVMDDRLPTTREAFYRQDLGSPFVSDESRLTPEVLAACVKDSPVGLKFRTSVMGIDVGKRLHVVIRGRIRDEWYLQEAFTVSEFDELEDCFRCYNIACCVVDNQPETRAARAFQRRHAGVVWLVAYVEHGLEPAWDWSAGLVKAPRTVVMDEMVHRVRTANFHLPTTYGEIEGGTYVNHLLALVRLEEPGPFGRPVARYDHRRPDDFAHAEVYATLGALRADLTGGVVHVGIGPDGRWQSWTPERRDFDV